MQGDSGPSGARDLDYLDFELEVSPGQDREYPVAVIRSPAGEAHETMHFPFDEPALENRLQVLQIALLRSGGKRRQMLSLEEQAVQGFGQALFDALFVGEVRNRYVVSQERARQEEKGLRLKMRIQSPELAALPWEFLYDSRQAEYVCLSRHAPVVRYPELPQVIQPLSVTPPLRILGMVASPRDLIALDVKREKQRVEEAIEDLRSDGLVDLAGLEGQTWRDLQRVMRGGPWHIFHFIGHGGFDPNAGEGLIALTDEGGRAYHLHATHLARLLAGHRSLRLVFLNSCEGARGSERNIFSSTAAILVRRSIPAVLAMQYEITDRAAIEFARAFYEAVADGWPVDAAVTEARIAVSLAVTNTVEWGTPVLYMRSPDGILFSIPEAKGKRQKTREKKSGTSDKRQEEANRDAARLVELLADLDEARGKKDWQRLAETGQAILLTEGIPEAMRDAARTAVADGYYWWSDVTLERDDCDAILRRVNRAIEASPEQADYYWMRGIVRDQQCKVHGVGEWAHVIADHSKAIDLDPQRADYYWHRGVSYHSAAVYGHPSGSYDQAIADCNRAIELDPQKADYYLERGRGYHAKGDYDQAIAGFGRAIELDPQNAEYYCARGTSYHAKSNYDRAIADFSRAIALDPQKAAYYFERSRSQYAKGDYDQAIVSLDRAIELDSQNAGYYSWRGWSHCNKGDYDQAIADFDRAIKLDPRRPEYHYAYGVSCSAKGDHDRAIASCSRAVRIAPGDAECYWFRSVCCYEAGHYDWAIADLDHAIALNHEEARYFCKRGASYLAKGDGDRAVTDLNHAVRLDPQEAGYYYWRGRGYYEKSDFGRAIADFDRAIELDPQEADYYCWRGMSYHEKDDYGRAIADFDRAIELDLQEAYYYYWRGLSYHIAALHGRPSGDDDRAIADFTAAIELDPQVAYYYYWRGCSYHAKDDYGRAITDFTRAIELDPQDSHCYDARGWSYYIAALRGHPSGDCEWAIADFSRAIELDPQKPRYYYSRGVTYKLKGDRKMAQCDLKRAARLGHANAKKELAEL